MSGEFGKLIDNNVRRAMGMSPGEGERKSPGVYESDLMEMLELLQPMQPFACRPGR